jgi:biotin carboxyl carrier protein
MSASPANLTVTHDDGRVEAWTVARADRTPDGIWRLALVDPAGAVHHVDAVADDGGDVWTAIDGVVHVVAAPEPGPRRRGRAAAAHGLEAPMPATVTRIVASVGQQVAAGDVLVLLEAMKMELAIRAPHDGTVTRIACQAGTIVQPGVPLVDLERLTGGAVDAGRKVVADAGLDEGGRRDDAGQ